MTELPRPTKSQSFDESDPFSMTFAALWELAESSPRLGQIVRMGNRIKLSDRDAFKPQVQSADLPELILVSEGLSGNLHETSSTSRFTRNYAWLISTGDMRLTHLLYPVEWALVTAMLRWKETLSRLVWRGDQFVKRAQITTVDEGVSDQDRNRGIAGWSSVWRVEVEMHFTTRTISELHT